jgi:hypothetical protein
VDAAELATPLDRLATGPDTGTRSRHGVGRGRTSGARRAPRSSCDDGRVTLADLSRLAAELDGVFESRRDGLLDWRYHGRLVARQLDDTHIVIRASFELRDVLLRSFPETFSVPQRFANHMMVVADLVNGNTDAVEDAVIAAWELQSGT